MEERLYSADASVKVQGKKIGSKVSILTITKKVVYTKLEIRKLRFHWNYLLGGKEVLLPTFRKQRQFFFKIRRGSYGHVTRLLLNWKKDTRQSICYRGQLRNNCC